MKVSSPIGDLPFKPTHLRVKNGVIHMEGSMGAWPANVQIDSSDIADILYLLRYVLLIVGIGIGLLLVGKSTRR
jgi:hypothetical protein